MKDEVWKDIQGYEGLYQVSSLGNVKSLDRFTIRKDTSLLPSKSRMIKQFLTPNGYLRVPLFKNRLQKKHTVHRLVAIAFLGNNPEMFVNHIAFDRTNNKIENLEWLTHQENMNHSKKAGRLRAVPAKRITDDIQKLAMATMLISKNESEICRHYNVNVGYIKNIKVRGDNKEFQDIFKSVLRYKNILNIIRG